MVDLGISRKVALVTGVGRHWPRNSRSLEPLASLEAASQHVCRFNVGVPIDDNRASTM